MFDKFFSLFTTALVVTAVGIALRPGAETGTVIKNWLSGFADLERAAAGTK